jgi:hypothetical protein
MILGVFLGINRCVTLKERSLRPNGLRRFAARFSSVWLRAGFAQNDIELR